LEEFLNVIKMTTYMHLKLRKYRLFITKKTKNLNFKRFSSR